MGNPSAIQESVDSSKRTALIATSAVGGIGLVCSLVPAVQYLRPSERAEAAGGPVEVDISALPAGEMLVTEWQGKPVWVLHRTKEMLQSLSSLNNQLADPESKANPDANTPAELQGKDHRSKDEKYLVVIGICTHLGCSPVSRFQPGPQPSLPDDWKGGFLCPCHGSIFDLAGRVYKSKPAPTNLIIPPYYIDGGKIIIGLDEPAKA